MHIYLFIYITIQYIYVNIYTYTYMCICIYTCVYSHISMYRDKYETCEPIWREFHVMW